MLVGEVDGEVAGWLSGGAYRGTDSDEPPLGEVYACYVDPAHWRQGVGSALMAALSSASPTPGIHKPRCGCWPTIFVRERSTNITAGSPTVPARSSKWPTSATRRCATAASCLDAPDRSGESEPRSGTAGDPTATPGVPGGRPAPKPGGMPPVAPGESPTHVLAARTRAHRTHEAAPAPQEGRRSGAEVLDRETRRHVPGHEQPDDPDQDQEHRPVVRVMAAARDHRRQCARHPNACTLRAGACSSMPSTSSARRLR